MRGIFVRLYKKMKIIKIILLFASIVFFTSIPLKAKAGHGDGVSIDCATTVKLHEKAWCKMKDKDTPSSTAKKEKSKKKNLIFQQTIFFPPVQKKAWFSYYFQKKYLQQ